MSDSKGSGSSGSALCSVCGKNANRFGFCKPHYEEFKFGLITKKGEPVPDYEKKLEHFKNYKSAQKAA